jgi:hypothetical protein
MVTFTKIPYADAVYYRSHPPHLAGGVDFALEYLSQLTALNRMREFNGKGNWAARMGLLFDPEIRIPKYRASVVALNSKRLPVTHPDRTTEYLLYQALMNKYPDLWPELRPLGPIGPEIEGDPMSMSTFSTSNKKLSRYREAYKKEGNGIGFTTKLFSELEPCKDQQMYGTTKGCRNFLESTLLNPDDRVYYSVPSQENPHLAISKAHNDALVKLWSPDVKLSNDIKSDLMNRIVPHNQAYRDSLSKFKGLSFSDLPEEDIKEKGESSVLRNWEERPRSPDNDYMRLDPTHDDRIHRTPSFHSSQEEFEGRSPIWNLRNSQGSRGSLGESSLRHSTPPAFNRIVRDYYDSLSPSDYFVPESPPNLPGYGGRPINITPPPGHHYFAGAFIPQTPPTPRSDIEDEDIKDYDDEIFARGGRVSQKRKKSKNHKFLNNLKNIHSHLMASHMTENRLLKNRNKEPLKN